MLVQLLIDKYARKRAASVCFVDPTTFREASHSKKILFVAHVWSVKSQTALVQLLHSLDNAPDPIPAVLVINADLELPPEVVKFQDLLVHGNGLVVMFNNGKFRAARSGGNLPEFTSTVNSFLAEATSQ